MSEKIVLPFEEVVTKSRRMIIPMLLILGAPYFILWSGNFSFHFPLIQGISNIFLFYGLGALLHIILFVIGVILHEAIHGLTASLFVKNGWQAVSFGFKREYLMPYCHIKEPVKVKHFILVGIMPAIILGIFPVLIATFNGNGILWIYGFVFTVSSNGDFIAIQLLMQYDKNAMVSDHPDQFGFTILDENDG